VSSHLKANSGGPLDHAQTCSEARALGEVVAPWVERYAASVLGVAPERLCVLFCGDHNLAPPGARMHPNSDAGPAGAANAWAPLLAAGFRCALRGGAPTNFHELLLGAEAEREYDNGFLRVPSFVAGAGVPELLREPGPGSGVLELPAAAAAVLRAAIASIETALGDLLAPLGTNADCVKATAHYAVRSEIVKATSDHKPITIEISQRKPPVLQGDSVAAAPRAASSGSSRSSTGGSGAASNLTSWAVTLAGGPLHRVELAHRSLEVSVDSRRVEAECVFVDEGCAFEFFVDGAHCTVVALPLTPAERLAARGRSLRATLEVAGLGLVREEGL
jgi:hypothetical protein